VIVDVLLLLAVVFGPAAPVLLMPAPRLCREPRPRRSRGRHRAFVLVPVGAL
jgi:hypothetical protein